MVGLGRLLILFGVVSIVAGLVLLIAPRIPWLGHLPGDVVVQRERFTLYVPIVTSLVVSVVLTTREQCIAQWPTNPIGYGGDQQEVAHRPRQAQQDLLHQEVGDLAAVSAERSNEGHRIGFVG